MVVPVRVLIAIFFVVAWPAAKLLELVRPNFPIAPSHSR